MDRDCAFQYATSNGIIRKDTGLITRDEADSLFEQYKPQFKKDLEAGLEPEMGIWVGMASDTDYREMGRHLVGADLEIRDGRIFRVEEVML